MKKALSILLSVMMVAGLFVALIPTASAAGYDSGVAIPEITLGELIYSEDFELGEEDAALTNADLADALGWSGSSGVNLSIVGDADVAADDETYACDRSWAVDGNNRVMVTSASSGSGSPTVLVDDRLAGGDYVLEYTAVMVANTSTSNMGLGFWGGYYPETTSSPSGSADAQGATYSTIWKFAHKRKGTWDAHTYYPTKVDSVNAGANTELMGTKSTTPASTDTYHIGDEFTYRVVVDADFGWYVQIKEGSDWVTYVSVADSTKIATWQKQAFYIGNAIGMRLLKGPTMLVDDIKVWTIDKSDYVYSEFAEEGYAPTFPNADNSELSDNALVITAVNTDAVPETSKYDFIIGHPNPDQTKYVDAEGNPVGAVELNEDGSYKYGQDGVNDRIRFEYVEVYNASNVTKNIYDYALGINNSIYGCYLTYATSSGKLDAIHPGKNTVTSKNNTWGYTYVNPDYADGAIAPGESAIIMIPNNWWNADCTNGTNESFRRIYLEQILGYTTEQADDVKVFTYAPEGGAGINNSGVVMIGLVPLVDGAVPTEYAEGLMLDQTYLESYVIANLGNGASVKSTPNFYFQSNAAGEDIVSGYPAAEYISYYAMNFDHWTDEGEYVPAGIVSANSNTLETTTPGTVPAELKKPVVEGAKNALWTGWQAAADGSIRLVAEIADIADVRSIGFEITIPDAEVTNTVYVNYVYNKLTTNFGEDDLGFKYDSSNYFVALAITGVGEAAPIDFQVKVVTVYTDGTVDTTGAVAFTAAFEA